MRTSALIVFIIGVAFFVSGAKADQVIGNFQFMTATDAFSKHGTANAIAVTGSGDDLFALRCIEGDLNFVVNSPKNDFNVGESLDLKYRIDNGDIHDLSAVALSKTIVQTQFAHGIFDELGAHNIVYVRVSGRVGMTFQFVAVAGAQAADAVKKACDYTMR